MWDVIPDKRFHRWCDRHDLDLSRAMFYAKTCYYGVRLRTRPGALIVYEDTLVHHSYAWTDTIFAAFEPSLRIEIPMPEITEVSAVNLSFWWRQAFMFPNGAFRVVTANESHELVFARDAKAFLQSLNALHENYGPHHAN
jgi:hypothetical protein